MILKPPCRWATKEDAAALAGFVNTAGHGLALYWWEKIAKESGDTTAWEVGRQRAQRETGSFSYRNAVLREVDGEVAAALIGYPLAEVPDPSRFDDLPEMFVPLQELEDLVPGTWYINVLATLPAMRGQGLGRGLLGVAEELERQSRCNGLRLIHNFLQN